MNDAAAVMMAEDADAQFQVNSAGNKHRDWHKTLCRGRRRSSYADRRAEK